MEALASHLPLILFTALCAIGAGAFLPMALRASVGGASPAKPGYGKLAWVPVAVLAIGFVAVFFHVTVPLNAPLALGGIGRSPLSNEVAVGGAFLALCLLYAVLTTAGKLSANANKAFLWVLAASAVVFGLFMGLAYNIATIPAWSSSAASVAMVALTLLGGCALGWLIVGLAGKSETTPKSVGYILLAVAVVSLVAAAIASGAESGIVAALPSFVHDTAAIAAEANGFIAGFTLCGILGVVCLAASIVKPSASRITSILSLAFVTAAIVLARCAFYLMEVGVAF